MSKYKLVESLTKPSEIDKSSSPDGIYIRRNITEVINEDGSTKYQYQEAFLNFDEYELYSRQLLINQMNGEDNTAEYEEYKNKLNTGVLYTNGKYYKPIWAELYNKKVNEIMQMLSNYEKVGGDTENMLTTKILITDATNKAENFVLMSVKEIIELWFFLLKKQEQFFNEYKQSLN